ncbi:hypothetical protein SDC9_122093 [bioreactor metagenome]|uniref:Uncharacterized protein n=1 Tax=bioreactor metagenome TaxID=1076179 RepID=A0A645CE16_9ZZZZ
MFDGDQRQGGEQGGEDDDCGNQAENEGKAESKHRPILRIGCGAHNRSSGVHQGDRNFSSFAQTGFNCIV